MNIILLRRLRWLVLAFMLCMLTVLLFGCFVPGGGYGYDDGGGIGGAYYEPFGFDYGGWGPDYQVAPYRGGDHRPAGGGGHALQELTDPRLLPARCRLFRRIRVLVARVPVARIPVARDHIEVNSSSVRQIY